MVMSGGIGKRFGTAIPKQYNMIKGKPVIDYVIDACRRSSLTDAVVVVCDPQCVSFSKELENGNLDIVHNGPERCWSIYNGLNYIKDNYYYAGSQLRNQRWNTQRKNRAYKL